MLGQAAQPTQPRVLITAPATSVQQPQIHLVLSPPRVNIVTAAAGDAAANAGDVDVSAAAAVPGVVSAAGNAAAKDGDVQSAAAAAIANIASGEELQNRFRLLQMLLQMHPDEPQ